jgi:hypothetical protein
MEGRKEIAGAQGCFPPGRHFFVYNRFLMASL